MKKKIGCSISHKTIYVVVKLSKIKVKVISLYKMKAHGEVEV